MCKVKVVEKAEEILGEKGELDTTELREEINDRLKHGTTRHELINLLGKNKQFVKLKKTKVVSGWGNGSFLVTVWRLA